MLHPLQQYIHILEKQQAAGKPPSAGIAASAGVSWVLAAYLSLPATSKSQYAERWSVIYLLKAQTK